MTAREENQDLQKQFDNERHKVDVDNFDITTRELIRMSSGGELKIAPAYQRKFRWKEESESVLIESLLLGLPVPSIFVATNSDGTWELVDGLQRVSTIIHFAGALHDSIPNVEEIIGRTGPLILTGLRKLTALNGKSFSQLPVSFQLHFFKRSMRVTALSDKSEYQLRFDLFERLNAGGIALTEQEIRSCIYLGDFNEMLRELSEYENFKSIIKLQKVHQSDGTDEELVLKFFAYLLDRSVYKDGVRDFLSAFMEKHVASKPKEWEFLFKKTIDYLHEFLDEKPFVRRGYSNTPLSQFEAAMVGIAEIIRSGKKPKKPTYDWINDERFIHFSTKGTNTRTNLNGRIARAKEIFSGT